MTTTKPRSVLLYLALAAFTLAGLASAANAEGMSPAAKLQAAAPAVSPVVYGPACPDVMVIGARGAGEAPSGVLNTSAYTTDMYHGVGKAVFSLYQEAYSGHSVEVQANYG
jgi:hypothetical protein